MRVWVALPRGNGMRCFRGAGGRQGHAIKPATKTHGIGTGGARGRNGCGSHHGTEPILTRAPSRGGQTPVPTYYRCTHHFQWNVRNGTFLYISVPFQSRGVWWWAGPVVPPREKVGIFKFGASVGIRGRDAGLRHAAKRGRYPRGGTPRSRPRREGRLRCLCWVTGRHCVERGGSHDVRLPAGKPATPALRQGRPGAVARRRGRPPA